MESAPPPSPKQPVSKCHEKSNHHPRTYDEVMKLFQEIENEDENGEIENFTEEELEDINEKLADFARQGVLPNEPGKEQEIEEDIEKNLTDSDIERCAYVLNEEENFIVPAVWYGGGYDIILCHHTDYTEAGLRRLKKFNDNELSKLDTFHKKKLNEIIEDTIKHPDQRQKNDVKYKVRKQEYDNKYNDRKIRNNDAFYAYKNKIPTSLNNLNTPHPRNNQNKDIKKKHHHSHEWVKKQFHYTKEFFKRHKKAIIIGVAVVIIAAVTGVVLAAPSSAGPRGPSNDKDSDTKELKDSPSMPSPDINRLPQMTQEQKEEQASSFKEQICLTDLLNSELPYEENMRILGQVFASQYSEDPLLLSTGNTELVQEFTKAGLPSQVAAYAFAPGNEHSGSLLSYGYPDYTPTGNPEIDFKTQVYQVRGERALDLNYNDQAISDLGKAIEFNPENPDNYLNRATAYYKTGETERSLEDYQRYVDKSPTTFRDVCSYSQAFVEGVRDGARDSGTDMVSFLANTAMHPINTAQQTYQAFATMSQLVKSNEWATISKALAPEISELATKWDTLSAEEKVYLSGKALGKHGSDILIPGAAVKLIAEVKTLQKVTSVNRMMMNAEKSFPLESAIESEICSCPMKTAETLSDTSVSMDKLAETGKVIDRADFTKAGRGLAKHGNRSEGAFPKPKGNPSQINEQGQKILESILNHPQKKITRWYHKTLGEVIDIEVPGVGGARFTGDGKSMIGFLEP
ncbi:MAG: tetratricopeptide repeat protein [Chlamydiota bacterium]